MVGFNQLSANWVDGFEIALGSGWQAGTLVGQGPPANCGGALTGGQWVWANLVTGTATGQSNGPGYFFDLNNDGNAGNDFGDNNTGGCTWNFCFQVTVGNTPGASLSVNVSALSDGEIGSWTSFACTGVPFNLSTSTVASSSTPVTVNTPIPICSGNSATLTASGANSYTWSPATGLSATTGATVTANPTTTTTYTVTGTGGCNPCTATTTVTVNPNPVVAVSPDPAEICVGGNVTLTANGATSYTWSPATGLSSTTGSNVTASPSTTTTYTITGTTGTCVGTVTHTVTVSANPTISITPSNPSICEGSTAVLTSNGAATYTWSPATGLSATTGATVSASPTTTTVYTVTGDSNGCIGTSSTTVTVIPISVNTSATPAVCTANNGTATATAVSGSPPFTYTWSTVPVQTTSTASGLAAGSYDVTVSDVQGCSITQTVNVPLDASNLTLPLPTTTATICTANNGSATANPVGGTAPYTYAWNTVPVETAQAITNLAAGNYSVTVTDANGCTATNTALVALDPGNLSVAINGSVNPSCFGECNGSATALANGGTAPIIYGWDDPLTQQAATANALCAGTYNVGVADANGCLATAQVVITDPLQLTISAQEDSPSDCGQPNGQLSATAIGGSGVGTYQFSWNTVPSQNTATATGLLPGAYIVTVTDNSGCQASANVTLSTTAAISASIVANTDATCFNLCDGSATVQASGNANPPLSYAWNTVPVQSTANATGLCAGTWTATITDGDGCVATSQITINEPTAVDVTTSASPTTICIGQSTALSGVPFGGTPPYVAFTWSANPPDATLVTNAQSPVVSPIVTTSYSLIVEDANGCSSVASSVSVTVRPQLSLSVTQPAPLPQTAICIGQSTDLNVVASGGDGAYTYYLQPDLATPINLPITVTPQSTQVYDFVVNDACGTPPATAQVSVTVNPLPVVDFAAQPASGCQPVLTYFQDLTNPPPVQWMWDFGDPDSGSNFGTLATVAHTYAQAGNYSVSLQVTDANGCTNSLTQIDTVHVYALPTANFTPDPTSVSVLIGRIFFNDGSSSDVTSWNWDFGDGGSSIEQNPSYLYTDTGTFTINLQVVNQYGCGAQASSTVEITPDYFFYVPSAFTPNGDGKNDLFRPYGEGVNWNSLVMRIFNRWGEEIYFTYNINEGWNGTFKNRDVEQGVYNYSISILDLEGKSETFMGRVTLIR